MTEDLISLLFYALFEFLLDITLSEKRKILVIIGIRKAVLNNCQKFSLDRGISRNNSREYLLKFEILRVCAENSGLRDQ